MKYYEPSYYNKFICASSKCTDTCCRFWQVELDNMTVDKYLSVKGNSEISARIKKALSIRSKSFRNNRSGSCPFLNQNLLCDLHTVVGHDNLPETCRLFPRFFNRFGGYQERGLSFSCPEAAKLIYGGTFNFNETENDSPVSEYTDVDAELFYTVKHARNKILSFIYKTDCDADKMLSAIINYSVQVQKYIDCMNINKIKELELSNSNEAFGIFENDKLRIKSIKLHKHLKFLRKSWNSQLDFALNNSPKIDIYALKVWLSYFIYRHLINAAYDKQFLSKVNASILSYLVISCLNLSFQEAMQKYSKEIEHSKYNIKKLFKFSGKTRFNLTNG